VSVPSRNIYDSFLEQRAFNPLRRVNGFNAIVGYSHCSIESLAPAKNIASFTQSQSVSKSTGNFLDVLEALYFIGDVGILYTFVSHTQFAFAIAPHGVDLPSIAGNKGRMLLPTADLGYHNVEVARLRHPMHSLVRANP